MTATMNYTNVLLLGFDGTFRLHFSPFFSGETVLPERGPLPVLHERLFLALLVEHVALRRQSYRTGRVPPFRSAYRPLEPELIPAENFFLRML